MCDLPGIFRKKPDVVTRRIAGEVLLIPIRGKLADMQRIFTLDAVGEFIWDRLDGESSLDGLVAELVQCFEVAEPRARTDLLEFIAGLLEADLIADVDKSDAQA